MVLPPPRCEYAQAPRRQDKRRSWTLYDDASARAPSRKREPGRQMCRCRGRSRRGRAGRDLGAPGGRGGEGGPILALEPKQPQFSRIRSDSAVQSRWEPCVTGSPERLGVRMYLSFPARKGGDPVFEPRLIRFGSVVVVSSSEFGWQS